MSATRESFLVGDTARRLFLILCGLALFVAGSLYLHVDSTHIDRAWLVTGGPGGLVAGETTAFRVTGRLLDERADVRVDVLQARAARGGAQARVDGVVAIPGRPATVVLPTAALEGVEELALDVDGGAGSRTLIIGLDGSRGGAADLPPIADGIIEGASTPHRVEVIPVGGVLVAGVPVEVLVRATAGAGDPLIGAIITATVRGREPMTCTTDTAGLCSLGELKASSRQVLHLALVAPSGERSEHTSTLDPATVKTALSPALAILPTGADVPARFVVRSYYDDELVYCDLWGGGVVAWSETHALQGGRATLEVPIPATGVWRLQCAYHPAMPGGAWATAVVMRSERGTSPLRAHAQDSDLSPWLAAVPPDGALGAGELARLIDLLGSRMRFEPQSAVVLLDTSAHDEAALAVRVADTKRTLLFVIGGIFAVMVLWMLLSVALGYQLVRRGFRTFRREQGEDPDTDAEDGRPTMSRSQAAVQVAALIIIVVLNVLAILMLLRMIG
ncbi:MAG: hypothetical protein AMXMBFR64_40160 [Myxococcales bacterium]